MSYLFKSGNKRIYISFDWHNDRNYRGLLSAWNENSRFQLYFEDLTPNEINSSDVARVKQVLTTKIRAVTHTLVLVGAHANEYHRDRLEIGQRNWIWWEIEKSKSEGNRLIGVKIDRSYSSPEPLISSGTSWAQSFTEDEVLRAINAA